MFKCDHPGCTYTHKAKQGITAHKNAKHISDEENAARVAKRLATIQARGISMGGKRSQKPVAISADDIFKRVEEATKILFPDPNVLYERFEEIAELRNAMLQALKR